MTSRPHSTPPPGAGDYHWYDSSSPEYPSSPLHEQQVQQFRQAAAARMGHQQHQQHHPHGSGMRTSSTAHPQPNSIYDLNTYPLPDGDSTVGITSYPRSAQHHHTKRRHSEQTNTLPPHHPQARKQPQQQQHYQYHQQHYQQYQQAHHHQRMNGGHVGGGGGAELERERFRRVSSPDGPPQSRIAAAHPGHLRPTHSYGSVAPSGERHGRRGREHRSGHVHRSASETNGTRPPHLVLNERNGGSHREHSLSAQPRSDSFLQYNSVDRGLIYQREGSPFDGYAQQQQHVPHPLSPSGPDMRAVLFEEVDYSNGSANVHDSSATPLDYTAGEQYHYTEENQRLQRDARPNSAKTNKKQSPSHAPRRAVTPNPFIPYSNRGDAWYNEDEDSESPRSPISATVGHMDHALLPQKFYFQTSSAPPHATPSSPYHRSYSQPTVADAGTHKTANKRHTPTAEVPPIPSPPPSQSGSSEGHSSSRRSSRDSGRMTMVSPTHNPRHSSLSSADSGPTSPVHISAYEKMLNGSASYVRNSPVLHAQPAVDRMTSPPPRGEPTSPPPAGTTRKVVSVVSHDRPTSPPSHAPHLLSSPSSGSDSPSRYMRKPHLYDMVRFPHQYEDVEYSRGQAQLSRGASKSEAKLNSKRSRSSKKNEGESRIKSASDKQNNMHLSDSRLNKIARRRPIDKPFTAKKSPSSTKRFSTGAFMSERNERRLQASSTELVKAKYRVSTPDPTQYLMSQQFSHYDEAAFAAAVGQSTLPEEDMAQEDDGCFDDFESSESDAQGYMQKRNTRSKSSGGMIIHKFSKKLSKLNLGGGGGKGGEGSGSGSKKKKSRTSSSSTLDPDKSTRLTQSMEQLSPLPTDDKELTRGFSTPGTTPVGTPKMSRSRSKTRLNRRNSEPDLEGALSTLFRSGSKKNLAQDTVEVLFDSIEHGNTDEVQRLLEFINSSDLNSTNEDDFLPVDLAAMLNHDSIVRTLLKKGAKDSSKYYRDPFSRFSRIASLLMEAERELDSLKCELVTQNVGSNNSGVRDLQRRLRKWEWKAHIFRRMKSNYEDATVPGPPSNVCLHVTSDRSLSVTFGEPENKNGAMVTRYKIEWCRSNKFTPIVGDFVMTDLRNMEYTIPDLNQGEAYFVRVYAYNMKGFGPAQMATPSSAVPSSWHDIDSSRPRYEGSTTSMHRITQQLINVLSRFNSSPPPNGNPSTNKTSKAVKKSISKLFGSAVKFHKTLKAGVYISSLVYSDEDKILTTVDDQIPIVEVSDSHSSNVGSDFVWLAKVACTWKHVKSMSSTTEQFVSSPAVQFRHKLLSAVLDLQAALGIANLGLLHPIPFKDSHGAIVFVIVHYCKEPTSLQTKGPLKWSNLPRLRRKRSQQPLLAPGSGVGTPEELESLPVSDRIVVDADEIIAHHKNSTSSLTRGLYLGYLKGRSSVASMRVICSREYPNVLPHHKIRDNPNISSEEWSWLKSLSSPSPTQTPETSPNHTPSPDHTHGPAHGPLSLQQALLPAIDTFLHNLGIEKDEGERHQLYCHEAIELNEDITLLLIVPSHDQICTPPGSSDHFAKLPNFVPLPINTFEIMQLFTYQQAFMADFSMVSARLEVELLASQQRMREAFSNAEGAAAKQMHKELEDLQEKTELEWKQMRWIDDAVQKGRDVDLGTDILLPVKTLRDVVSKQMEQEAIKRQREIMARIPSPQHRAAGPASGYLRVFPAYNTGLIKGTSVKLYITVMTTTSDVIRLVVHQLEKTRVERGIPGRMIMEDDLKDFYLVAVTGNEELVLNDDYNPLQLQTQSQTSKCQLYVRRRSEQLRFIDQVTTV